MWAASVFLLPLAHLTLIYQRRRNRPALDPDRQIPGFFHAGLYFTLAFVVFSHDHALEPPIRKGAPTLYTFVFHFPMQVRLTRTGSSSGECGGQLCFWRRYTIIEQYCTSSKCTCFIHSLVFCVCGTPPLQQPLSEPLFVTRQDPNRIVDDVSSPMHADVEDSLVCLILVLARAIKTHTPKRAHRQTKRYLKISI